MPDTFSTTIRIDAAPAKVWATLTEPELMSLWMGETGMPVEIATAWQLNTAISIRGFHHAPFENHGLVLEYVEEERLAYSHLSSLSNLPDRPENYSVLTFALTPAGPQTLLTLTIQNFPTETIRKHLEFYWRATMAALKDAAEM